VGAESVDTFVHHSKAPLGQEPSDGPRAEAELEKLCARHHAELTTPEIGEALITIPACHPVKLASDPSWVGEPL
jgi:hypothetical protein